MDSRFASFTKFLIGTAGLLSPIQGIQIAERSIYSGAQLPLLCAQFIEKGIRSTYTLGGVTYNSNPCYPLDPATITQIDPWVFYGPTWLLCLGLIGWGIYENVKKS